jgi:hypothetical protein
MSTKVPSQGAEQRQSILPSGVPQDLGFFGSSYNPADQLPSPDQIGVRSGDNMEDVINAVRGVAYYTDMIGFGQSSNSFTSGMNIFPMGVNYFLPTGLTCSNGAKMYQYIQGIPEGNALGERVKQSMANMGLPQLRGLAPGIIEDAKNGLNPFPLMNAAFGSGYPKCQLFEGQVGDVKGNIMDSNDPGQTWIGPTDGIYKKSGDNKYYQKRWIQAKDQRGNPINLTRDQYEADKKTMNPDGTPKMTEQFSEMGSVQTILPFFVLAGLLGTAFITLTLLRKK